MASYVKNFFTAKRRKTDCESSSEDSDNHFPRPNSAFSSGPSGASTSSGVSSTAFLSPSSTANSMDFLYGNRATSPSTSSPVTFRGGAGGRSGLNGHTGLQVSGIGHRRQHSSPGHLQQHQQEIQAQQEANLARIASRRREKPLRYDPDEAKPVFAGRSPYYQSKNHLAHKNIRMILIEAESRVLYDSSTVIPISYGAHPQAKSVSPCGEFQFLKHRKDTKKLSQMIFGAVPNLKANESFRLHVLEDEEMILVSKTFVIPKYKKGGLQNGLKHGLKSRLDPLSSDSDSQSTVKSLDGWRTKTTKSIMTTPEAFHRVRHVSITFGEDGGDTETNYGGSPGSSMSLPRAFSPPHRISKQRRRNMAANTSLSETHPFSTPSSLKARSRMSSMCSSQADDDSSFQMQNMRNVALGILVPSQHRYFLMQHIPLIEAEMSRLEARIVNASLHPSTFLQNITKSWAETTEIITQLHNAPRLKHPYWLALNEECHLDGRTLAGEFCKHLAYLVRRFDRKEAGYFMSNLVTALLMHHMSWVASVATPPLGTMDRYRNPRNNMLFGMNTAESGAPTVGYNALMAQYLEIAGACGNVRSAKVCILGDDLDIMASLIAVLSFFIRCSAVQHIDHDNMWEVPTEQPFNPIDVSGSPTTLPGCSHHHQNLNGIKNGIGSAPSAPSHPNPHPHHHQNSEETSSVAMMRRLRNNNSMEPVVAVAGAAPSTSQAAMLMDQELADQDFEMNTSGPSTSNTVQNHPQNQHDHDHQHHHQEHQNPNPNVTINRNEYPCCPTISDDEDMWSPRPNPIGLGRSMFAGPLDNYCPHFVLSGVLKQNANMPDVYSRMFDEVRCCSDPLVCHRTSTSTAIHHQSMSSNHSQSTSSINDQSTPEDILIVADFEQMTVKVLSSEGSDEVTSPSESVVGMLEQFMGMYDDSPEFSPEFLVGIIEDGLAHVVTQSLTLVELVRSDNNPPQQASPSQLTPDKVRTIIGCDHSDLRLIINVAAVYWPPVLQSVLG